MQALDTVQEYGPFCNKMRPCRRFRQCNYCARLRQARFADLAEQVIGNEAANYLTRLTPYQNFASEIERLKSAWKRQNIGARAVWTIEQGSQKSLLHLNIISGSAGGKPLKQCEQWHSEKIDNLRRVAAYILKPEQYPDEKSYSGRQYGSFGSITELLIQAKNSPIIQAAAIENLILGGTPLPTPYIERQQAIAEMHGSKEHYKQVADRNLPKMRAYIDALKGTIK